MLPTSSCSNYASQNKLMLMRRSFILLWLNCRLISAAMFGLVLLNEMKCDLFLSAVAAESSLMSFRHMLLTRIVSEPEEIHVGCDERRWSPRCISEDASERVTQTNTDRLRNWLSYEEGRQGSDMNVNTSTAFQSTTLEISIIHKHIFIQPDIGYTWKKKKSKSNRASSRCGADDMKFSIRLRSPLGSWKHELLVSGEE